MSPRLLPIDFLENLESSRSLTFYRKNVKKILRTRTEDELKPAKFRRCISNSFCFPTPSKNLSKKNWGRPRTPAPNLKNLEKIMGVGFNDFLKPCEFH